MSYSASLILLAFIRRGISPIIQGYYRPEFLFLLAILCSPAGLLASGVHLGLSAVEEGDDRLHPAITFHSEISDFLNIRIHYYGQNLEPIKERQVLSSVGYRFPFMKFKSVNGALGVSYLRKEIRLPDTDYAGGQFTTNTAGLHTGIFWTPFPKVPFKLTWESNLFLAGSSSILLTTARRQALSISGGLEW